MSGFEVLLLALVVLTGVFIGFIWATVISYQMLREHIAKPGRVGR